MTGMLLWGTHVVHDIVLKNGIVWSEGKLQRIDVGIQDGRFSELTEVIQATGTTRSIDVGGCLVLPGVIDAHTHIDLGLFGMHTADSFSSGTAAAVRGGITTIIDFSDPSPGESPFEALKRRIALAEGRCYTDFSLHTTILPPLPETLVDEFSRISRRGSSSFKVFTAYKKQGRMLDDGQLYAIAEALSSCNGILTVHAENDDIIDLFQRRLCQAGRLDASAFAESRPVLSETEAVRRLLLIAAETGCPLHFVHISTPEALGEIARAKAMQDVTVETCPHYLFLDRRFLDGPDGFLYTCCPPLRDEAKRASLERTMLAGSIDFCTTDHCAFTHMQKSRGMHDFRDSLFGLPGVETLFPLLFTSYFQSGLMGLTRLVELLSEGPARRFGLFPQKGTITVGSDADCFIVETTGEPEASWLEHSITPIDWSPYRHLPLAGFPRHTFVRGIPVILDGKLSGAPPHGRFLPMRPMTRTGRQTASELKNE